MDSRLIVRYLIFSLVLFRLHPTVTEAASFPVVTIPSAPERPIIESRDRNQFLNFDLIVRNVSQLTLRLSEIQLAVYDSTHSLVMMESLNTDALAPSIAVIGKETMAPGEHLDVFNPFFRFDSIVPLSELRYSFCLLREENERERERNLHRLPDDCDFQQQVTIAPRTYGDKTPLILPLREGSLSGKGTISTRTTCACRLATAMSSRGGSRRTRITLPATLSTLTKEDALITTTPGGWRTGTAIANPFMHRERESFWIQPMTSPTTGLKMPMEG
jgi:hypothetical protein